MTLQVWTWLQMVAIGGDYPKPTSEAVYLANLASIDAVMPTNGGKLQAGGSWKQESEKIDPAWPQSLPTIAAANGHLYIPSVEVEDTAAITTVLDSAALQAAAIADLIALAITGRFDSPWDGVFLDLENIPSAYKEKLSEFLTLLSNAIRDQGLLCCISVRGKVSDPGPDYDTAYAYDFSILNGIADFVDVRLYGFWNPLDDPYYDRSMGPYWWVSDCLDYAMGQGILRDKILLGYGTFGRYYPDSEQVDAYYVTHAQALTLCGDAATYLQWQETGAYGRVREKSADLGAGHVWAHDLDTTRHALGLATERELYGIAYFVPGQEDNDTWTAINEWRAGEAPWHGYILTDNLALTAGQYADFLALVQGQGRLAHWNPSNLTHSRTLDASETVVEAVFRYGEMAQEQCIQWLAITLGVDPAGVSCSEAGNVWTLTYDGTDYVDLTLFGGHGSSWETSGTACRAYVG